MQKNKEKRKEKENEEGETYHTEAQAGWPLTCSALPSALSRMYSFSSFPRNIYGREHEHKLELEHGRGKRERQTIMAETSVEPTCSMLPAD